MRDAAGIREAFECALDALVVELRRDPYVLAAILLGSLSYDTVWGKSDIDLLIVTQETKHCSASVGLVQEGINVHAFLLTRSGFKKTMEGAVQSSFMHSLLMKGGILFSRDETIEEMFANRERKRPLHSR